MTIKPNSRIPHGFLWKTIDGAFQPLIQIFFEQLKDTNVNVNHFLRSFLLISQRAARTQRGNSNFKQGDEETALLQCLNIWPTPVDALLVRLKHHFEVYQMEQTKPPQPLEDKNPTDASVVDAQIMLYKTLFTDLVRTTHCLEIERVTGVPQSKPKPSKSRRKRSAREMRKAVAALEELGLSENQEDGSSGNNGSGGASGDVDMG